MRIYFGTADQPAESVMTGLLDDATLAPAYRNFCYVFFDDCYIGTYNRAPMVHFVLRKHPACLDQDVGIRSYDYNGAYMLYQLLSQQLDISTDYLDSTSFLAEANRLYNEDFGCDLLLDKYQPGMSYLESILTHIDGLIYFDVDNKFHLKLLRADGEVAELPTLETDMFLEPPTFNRKAWLDTNNEIKIQFPLRQLTNGTVIDPDSPPLTISGDETFACPGSYQYTADGGTPPYDWAILSGDATVDGNGWVTVNSCGDFTVQVTDQDGNTASM
jgi:hypothetical protein